MKIKSLIKQNIHQLLLFTVITLLFITNYKQGSYLIGWDNFNSEFKPWMAVTQASNAGWSQFRSFGLVAGMGYATDLWHAIFVWLASFVLPVNTIRYIFNLLILYIGGLGVYYLFRFFKIRSVLCFVAALYYMLNFGTLQIFNLPYEPFSIFFGFLPWSILVWFDLMNGIDKKRLIQFFIVNLLMSGAFYVQTMFVVYVLFLSSINVIYLIKHRINWTAVIRKTALIWLLIIVINSYWLLSQAYFLTDAVKNVRGAKQTILGWRVPFYQNQAHSNIIDFFTQKGYYADFNGSDEKPLFSVWLDFLNHKPIFLIQFILILFIVLGILDGKNKYKKYFIVLLFYQSVALLMSLPVLKQVNEFFRNSSFIDQILRSPFSKFAMSQSLVMTYFLVLGLGFLLDKIQNVKIAKNIILISIIAIVLLSLPSFRGNFFSPKLKVTIPQEYFDLFRFFGEQNINKRLAVFPEGSVWGWYTYNWGYMGSGFLRHGIAQPIISRSYDVWSRNSENYFWEMKTAINRRDEKSILNILEKYNIRFILIDNSLTSFSPNEISLQKELLKYVFASHNNFKSVFESKNLHLYELIDLSTQSLLMYGNNIKNIAPNANSIYEDNAYNENNVYFSNDKIPYNSYYPFLDLQGYTTDPRKNWSIKENENLIELTTHIPDFALKSIPQVDYHSEDYWIQTNENVYEVKLPVTITKQKNNLIVSFPKILLQPINYTNLQDCKTRQPLHGNLLSLQVQTDGFNIKTSEGQNACWGFHYNYTNSKYAYLLKVTTENIEGLPISMYINGLTNQERIIDQLLNKESYQDLIIPSQIPDGLGLSVNFQNNSFNNSTSENYFKSISLYIFPEKLIKELHYNLNNINISSNITPTSINRINSWKYATELSSTSNNEILFFQSFDPGWIALQNGKILQKHVLVNNWANGWKLDQVQSPKCKVQSCQITILFWPQYLEFLGFGLIIISLIFVLQYRHEKGN